jgi:hypothetical protein
VAYQNRIGKLAWSINSMLGRSALPSAQAIVFDRMVPLLRAFEGENPSSGLSLIAVGVKQPASEGA